VVTARYVVIPEADSLPVMQPPPPYSPPPYGYGQGPPPNPWGAQPPPPRKSNTALILAIVGGCLVLLLLVAVPFGIGVYRGFQDAKRRATAPSAPALLSESYATGNGLATLHYPSDFAAKSLDDSTVMVSRNLSGGLDEVVIVGAVKQPITNDVHELARILDIQMQKTVTDKGGTYRKTGERAATCLGSHPGLETEMRYSIGLSGEYASKACFFVHGGHGYELRYNAPASRLGTEAALLERIENATDLAR
jgi:hypothetical protein